MSYTDFSFYRLNQIPLAQLFAGPVLETLFYNSYGYRYKALKKFSETSLIMCAHIKYSKGLNPGRLMCGSGFWFFFAIFVTTGLDSESQVYSQCWCLHLPGNPIWFARKPSLNCCHSLSFPRVIKKLREFVSIWENSEKASDHWTFSNTSFLWNLHSNLHTGHLKDRHHGWQGSRFWKHLCFGSSSQSSQT